MFAAAIARARVPAAGGRGGAPSAPTRRTFFNVTVGRKASRATLFVDDHRQVVALLQALSQHGLLS